MFAAIGGVFGKMFGTEKALTSVIDNVSSGLDNCFYTDQEKAEDGKAERSEARKTVVEWMKNSQGQNLARRLIALLIVFTWLLQYITMQGLSIVAVWVENPEKFVKSADVIGGYAESMNGAVMLILAFYFAAPHMGSIVTAALGKFGGTKK